MHVLSLPLCIVSLDGPLTPDTTVVLEKYHRMLFFLAPAMYPWFLITLNNELNPIPVTVRDSQVSYCCLARTLSPVSDLVYLRLSMLLVKLVSQERYLGSRHLSSWAQRNAWSCRPPTEEYIAFALESFVILEKNSG
jgi:hypothetical protein